MEFWNEQYMLMTEFITENFHVFLLKLFYTVIVIILTIVAMRLREAFINKIFSLSVTEQNKAQTLCSLLLSLSRYIIYALSGLVLLSVYNVNIAPFLASAGIAGLAIGFGAQNLVKDIITGFFIMFEEQYHVGDFVEINGQYSGTIEELGLRMTTIRQWSGKKFYIANSEITTVNNFNRGLLRVIISVSVPFEEDLQKVFKVLNDVCTAVITQHSDKFVKHVDGTFMEAPHVFGITDINTDERGAKFTINAVVEPQHYWFMERELRRVILEYFKRENIRIAYPQISIYNNENHPMLANHSNE